LHQTKSLQSCDAAQASEVRVKKGLTMGRGLYRASNDARAFEVLDEKQNKKNLQGLPAKR